MAWECVVKDKAIDDVRRDRKGSRGIEKYNISGQALYFQGKYLPLAQIKSVRVQPSVYSPNGCCGRGIPVYKIRIDYGEEKPIVLMMEKEQNANRAVSMILAGNSAVVVEEYKAP